jgi:hypothetical protein
LQVASSGAENEGVALPVVHPMNIEATLDCNNLEDLARFWQEVLGCEARGARLVERARLLCPAQPDLKYAGPPEAHLIFRKPGPSLGAEPLAG